MIGHYVIFHSGEIFEIINDNGTLMLNYEDNVAECRRGQYLDSIQHHFHPPDIKSVTYLSNGSTLNATLWLSSAYKNPAENASAWLSSNIRDSPWYSISYILSLDVHGAYDVKHGADYGLRYDWDAMNESWTRGIEEIAPSGEIKYIEPKTNYDIFKNNNSKNYIDMSLDLSRLNYPEQYSIVFSVYDYFVRNGRVCALSDITPRVTVSPTNI